MIFLLCLVLVFTVLSMGVVVHLLGVIFHFVLEVIFGVVQLVEGVFQLVLAIAFMLFKGIGSIVVLALTLFWLVVRAIASSVGSRIDDLPETKPTTPAQQLTNAPEFMAPKVRPVSPQAAMLWCFVAPSCVLAAFVLVSEAPNSRLDQAMTWVRSKLPRQSRPVVERVTRDQLILTSWTTPMESANDSNKRPDWTLKQRTLVGEIQNIVVVSKLWSTEQEAVADLNEQTGRIVKADFEASHHGLLDPKRGFPMSNEEVAKLAVTNRYLERTEQDFGSFTAPMYRMWYLVQLSPIVRTELYPVWKAAIAKNRLLVLGGGLATLTLFANLFWMSLKMRTAGNHSRGFTAAWAMLTGLVWIPVSASIILKALC